MYVTIYGRSAPNEGGAGIKVNALQWLDLVRVSHKMMRTDVVP